MPDEPNEGHDRPASGSGPGSTPRFPRVPAHAWTWFQRSRPVVTEAAQRLTGRPPSPGFVEDLRAAFGGDAFVQAVVADVVADIAFRGRIPQRRPAGVSWDRGLTWWAAALAGVTPAAFEARSREPDPSQRALFERERGDADDAGEAQAVPTAGELHDRARAQTVAQAARTPERGAVAAALRDLLAQAEGGQIPASVVRQLLAHLEAAAPDLEAP
ncbi:hypothetical protein BH23ACT8_BH23ACT8_07060 [soil metagenome]